MDTVRPTVPLYGETFQCPRILVHLSVCGWSSWAYWPVTRCSKLFEFRFVVVVGALQADVQYTLFIGVVVQFPCFKPELFSSIH